MLILMAQVRLVVNEFTPKPDGDGYVFNVPSLGASQSLHIVTPSYFDGSIELFCSRR